MFDAVVLVENVDLCGLLNPSSSVEHLQKQFHHARLDSLLNS